MMQLIQSLPFMKPLQIGFLATLLVGCASAPTISNLDLTQMIQHNLRKASDELADVEYVDINCSNYIVLLTGEVPNNETKELAGKTANISPVRKVYNEIKVTSDFETETPFRRRTETPFRRQEDSKLLMERVMSELYAKDVNVNGSNLAALNGDNRIRVVVQTGAGYKETGTVFLMGMVSHNEAEKISKILLKITGVDRVVPLFEYID